VILLGRSPTTSANPMYPVLVANLELACAGMLALDQDAPWTSTRCGMALIKSLASLRRSAYSRDRVVPYSFLHPLCVLP
jgi:hypothetical protein